MTSQDEELRLQIENLDLRRLLAKAGIDAAEQEIAQKLQHLISQELHHRVKNTLSIVKAIASQSLRAAETLDEARNAIESRLLALSRAHDLLLQAAWIDTTLEAVVQAAIEPFETPDAEQFSVNASGVKVAAVAVVPIAMVINELCTNAVKYGALSNAKGRVEIQGSIDAEKKLFHLSWTEKNGPIVQQPKRRSFGSKLVEHAFVGQLQGTARLEFQQTGVTYSLQTPIDALGPQISN